MQHTYLKDSFVTIGIKPKEDVDELVSILQFSGIETHTTRNDIDSHGVVRYRLRVHEKHSVKAIRVLQDWENGNTFVEPEARGRILVPIDFNDLAITSLNIANLLALNLKKELVILHVHDSPRPTTMMEKLMSSGERERWRKSLHNRSESQFKAFINDSIDKGNMKLAPYTMISRSGIAEKEIKEVVYQTLPEVLVIATRSKEQKDKDLLGSVTVQEINQLALPIFVVPASTKYEHSPEIHILMLYNNNVDHLQRQIKRITELFTKQRLSIELCHMTIEESIDEKAIYLNYKEVICQFPQVAFSNVILHEKQENYPQAITTYFQKHQKDILVLNNQIRSSFSQLLTSNIASQLAYDAQVPMIVFGLS